MSRNLVPVIVLYLFVLHFVTCPKTCHFAASFTSLWTSISVFYVNTARDVVTVLLTFAKYLSLYLHIFTCTHKGTHTSTQVQSAHKRNGNNQAQEPGWEGRKKGFVRPCKPKKKSAKNRYSRIWGKRYEHMELPAKQLDDFSRSNKSNINQSWNLSELGFSQIFPLELIDIWRSRIHNLIVLSFHLQF